MSEQITVSLVYRNYKPLHSMYVSIVRTPPQGVKMIAPAPKSKLGQDSILFKIYRKFGRNRLVQTMIKHVDKWLFSKPAGSAGDSVDLYHYINMVPDKRPGKPYVVEFEHVGALFSFVFDERRERAVKTGLKDGACRAIICSSQAAKKTLRELFGDDYESVADKVSVIYPALDRDTRSLESPDDLAKKKSLRLLFVGNDAYRKGLEEILSALRKTPEARRKNFELTVVSGDAGPVIDKYPDIKKIVRLLPPTYSKRQIINDFYRKSDLFILLTKQDTFGFAALDAMSCGVPVIATKQFAMPEIVRDGQDGILLNLSRSVLDEEVYYSQDLAKQVNRSNIDEELVAQFTRTLVELDQDRGRIKTMGKNALQAFRPAGRFSVETRNRQLLRIYKSAVNGKIG